jgi:hypothetical protein
MGRKNSTREFNVSAVKLAAALALRTGLFIVSFWERY